MRGARPSSDAAGRTDGTSSSRTGKTAGKTQEKAVKATSGRTTLAAEKAAKASAKASSKSSSVSGKTAGKTSFLSSLFASSSSPENPFGSAKEPTSSTAERAAARAAERAAAKAEAGTAVSPNSFAAFPMLFKVIIGIAAFLTVFIMARLLYLQVVNADELRQQALETRTWPVKSTPSRGTIYDRRGNVLAISVPAVTIYADPTEIKQRMEDGEDIDPEDLAFQIAIAIGGDRELYLERLTTEGVRFVYIQRQATLEAGAILKELDLPGIYFQSDTRREYPYGEVAGQIIGLCNMDGEGMTGLELYYDDILRGTPGLYIAEFGADGTPIPGSVIEETPAVSGQDIMITIDIELQIELEDALKRSASYEHASSTHAIVMDASNGEILAMASLPLYDPSGIKDYEVGADVLKGVTWTYEPGSTFKTVSAMSILEHGAMEPTDEIFAPVELEANDKKVTDTEVRGDEMMTLNHIIGASSNVGIALAVQEKLGFELLYEDILRYGFTELTGIDFPGEATGYIDEYDDNWTKIQEYNVSFGQGILVTPIQMARFYCALANGGVACTPHFLLTNITTGEDAVFPTKVIIPNEEAVDKMAGVLRHVVVGGTSPQAAIPGYYVVGKSGTAEIYDEWGGYYRTDAYNRSFIGYLVDASMPLVCYFCANEVEFSGNIAPSTFKTIMKVALERYRVTSKWDGQERD